MPSNAKIQNTMVRKYMQKKLTSGNVPGVPLLDVLQETSRLLKNNIDDTDNNDDGGDGDGEQGDLLAPGHQEGSSVNRPSPPRPTPA